MSFIQAGDECEVTTNDLARAPTNSKSFKLVEESSKRARTQASILVCAFEGTIGIGKTTLLENIKATFHGRKTPKQKELLIVVEEPVEVWNKPIQIDGETRPSILEQMYKGTCLPVAFQLMALSQRYGTFIQALEDARRALKHDSTLSRVIIVTERSAIGDMMFAHINLKDVTDKHMYENALTSIFASVNSMHDIKFCCFNLRVDIGTIVTRIMERNRLVEINLIKDGKPNDYLTALTQVHDSVLNCDSHDSFKIYYDWVESMGQRFELHCIDASFAKDVVSSNVLSIMDIN